MPKPVKKTSNQKGSIRLGKNYAFIKNNNLTANEILEAVSLMAEIKRVPIPKTLGVDCEKIFNEDNKTFVGIDRPSTLLDDYYGHAMDQHANMHETLKKIRERVDRILVFDPRDEGKSVNDITSTNDIADNLYRLKSGISSLNYEASEILIQLMKIV